MDGQPVKLFEYMAAGLPVIASDFPQWRPFIDGCGLAVSPKDPSAIAEAISFLLSHPEQSEKMGLNGRMRVQEMYNWHSEERSLLELYEKLLCPDAKGAVTVDCLPQVSDK